MSRMYRLYESRDAGFRDSSELHKELLYVMVLAAMESALARCPGFVLVMQSPLHRCGNTRRHL